MAASAVSGGEEATYDAFDVALDVVPDKSDMYCHIFLSCILVYLTLLCLIV